MASNSQNTIQYTAITGRIIRETVMLFDGKLLSVVHLLEKEFS